MALAAPKPATEAARNAAANNVFMDVSFLGDQIAVRSGLGQSLGLAVRTENDSPAAGRRGDIILSNIDTR